MKSILTVLPIVTLLCLFGSASYAQDATLESSETPESGSFSESISAGATEEAIDLARGKLEGIAERLDENPRAQEASAGILKPIYTVAEHLSFPAFHWVAFAIMATGVVSFALQLVLGKLVVLSRMGFSPTEILSDALGLAISVVGLVLTTQAAAENSNFAESPASVVSAAGAGLLAGFVFYLWGQRQELQAVRGRSGKEKRAVARDSR